MAYIPDIREYKTITLQGGYTPPACLADPIGFGVKTIDDNAVDWRGNGYLGGDVPGGVATFNGSTVSGIEIRVLLRTAQGEPGDGALVATTTSAGNGSWRVAGLAEHMKFDVVARRAGCNDVITANVSPAALP